MKIHSAEHTFVYIDPNQKYVDGAVLGDGSTPETPLWDFPTTLTDNKIYLVRRSANGYYASVSNNTSSNAVTSFVLWGMPKPTDDWWDKVPAQVRTLWLDEDKPKAYVRFSRNTSYHTINIPYCKNLDIRGFVFYSTGDCRSYCGIRSGTSCGGTNAYIDHIHFRDFDNDFTTGQSPDYLAGGRYMDIGPSDSQYAHNVQLQNCTIDRCFREWALTLGRVQYIHINNLTINVLQCSESSAVIEWTSDEWIAPFVTIENCYAWLYKWAQRDRYMPDIFGGDCTTLTAKHLTYKMAPSQYWTPYNNEIYIGRLLSHNLRSPGSVVEDVVIDFSNEISGLWRDFIYLEYRQNEPRTSRGDASYGQYNIVKNVTINCSRNPQYGCGGSDTGGNPWYESYYSRRGLITLTRYDRYDRVASSDYLIQDIHIVAPRGVALNLSHTLVDMKSCDVEGSVCMERCVGKLGTLTTWYPGYALYDGGGNILYIKSIVANRNNPNWEFNGQHAIVPSYRSNVLCGTTNTPFMPATFQGTNETLSRNSYICTNDQTAGNYTVRNSFSSCKTWSINRVGSTGGCSLKLLNETAGDTSFPLLIGGEPFKGISSTVTAGDHVATIYLTMCGYNDYTQIKDKFRCRIRRADGSIVCQNQGNWSEDTVSVWENVEGSTSYKLEIPFHMDEAGEIEFEYQFSWYMQGAATYLDPYPSIS